MSADSKYLIDVDKPLILGTAPLSDNPFDIWPPPRNYNPPSGCDWFQRELIRTAGLTPNGLPMLRLEWGSIATWTPYTPHLKYLHRIQDRHTGMLQDVRGVGGEIVKTIRYPLGVKIDVPEPNEKYGVPYPEMVYREEIGIPRWWISQYTPPDILGPWEDMRRRVRLSFSHPGEEADIGPMPRDGFYFLGFHCIAQPVPHVCCEKAKLERRRCFHLYREPSNLDLEYVKALWHRNYATTHTHDWREAPDAGTMRKNLMRILDADEELEKKERQEMKLRIRDTFKVHNAQYTSRKKKNTWIFSSAGGERKVY